ncbi:hypothetical protein PAHAL_2G132900 [Panicum hallii]|uniref:Chlorophyllase n=1 Tax=Panicum hallii TaxID=206008 RepID=A0A2T8KP38_9POAL|nr:hypothetical protein PAHAL_2G132900 [Panicum hallii]
MATQQVPEPPPVVVTSVFQPGKLSVEMIPVDHDALSMPPIPILIAAPKDAGTYPVAFHTSLVSNGDADDIAAAARVTDWLPGGLPAVLPAGVEADLSRLALAGHSPGGRTAFVINDDE